MSDLIKKFMATQKGPVWEDVMLPSKGLYYGGNRWSKIGIDGGVIQVKAWGAEEEKILHTTRYLRANKAVDMIFERCAKFPKDFDVDDLLVGDRAFLLFVMRGISFGNVYEFSARCTNDDCKIVSPHECDLNHLARNITWANKDKAPEEPIKVELPDASAQVDEAFTVGFRFARHRDIKNMELKEKARAYGKGGTGQKDPGPDDTVIQQLLQLVVEAGGTDDPNVIASVVNHLSIADRSFLREKVAELTPGIDPQINIECTHCGNKMEMGLPITESFFRFTGRRSGGESLGVVTGRNVYPDEAPAPEL